MASTYTPIATSSPSGTQTVTFSSIPSTYTDLVIVVNATMSADSNVYMTFNGDTGSNYSITNMYGNNTGALSTRQTSQTQFLMSLSSFFQNGVVGNMIVNINNYANTSTYKTTLSRFNNQGVAVQAAVGLWRSTSAINSISIYSNQGNWSSGSTFTLYGITAA